MSCYCQRARFIAIDFELFLVKSKRMKIRSQKTLFEKIWEQHVVYEEPGGPGVLYIDTHFIHEVTSPQAFQFLRNMKLRVRRKDRTFATCDHNVSTTDQLSIKDKISRLQVETLVKNCREYDIPLYGLDSPHQGIVHIIGPELGITQPGMTIVCGDSHTSTHGAFGTIAWGVGTSEIGYVLATQCLLQTKPKTMEIRINGSLGKGVTPKDVIIKIIATIGVGGGVGFALEYTGDVIDAMEMEGRMTVCNMSIEGGARYGMVAPDDTTLAYMKGKPFAPAGSDWDAASVYWRSLSTDVGAVYDKRVTIDASAIEPMITYGTSPAMAIPITGRIPTLSDMPTDSDRKDMEKALTYMKLEPGMRMEGFPIDEVFIGSCTNARLSDLRAAAKIVKGKKVKDTVKAIVVPGSRAVKRAAEAEGLDRIFTQAGFSWRWSGCSACIAMNDDKVSPGNYCVSTSNRNYEGRQGPGARTILASPIMAAAAAIEGKLVDVRNYL